MENIESLKKYLLTIHPVRKSGYQKEEFRKWLSGELRRSGWRSHEERYGKFNGSVNVIAGDPDKATVFLCAHYDTASRMLVPNFVSPTNVAAHVIYHFSAAFLMVVLALLVSFAVSFPLDQPHLMLPLFVVLALALLWVSVYGPANRSNANGNTSGILTLLSIAKALPHSKQVCLLFLDNNERNLLGAGAFRKKHPNAAASALFINFDCVGDGDNLRFFPTPAAKKRPALLEALAAAFPGTGEKNVEVVRGFGLYPSDQRWFPLGFGVAAFRRIPLIGEYLGRIHTRRDTVLEGENVRLLAEGALRFAGILARKQDKIENRS